MSKKLERHQPEPTVMNRGAERLTYEIRVRGELTEALVAALKPLGLEVEALSTARFWWEFFAIKRSFTARCRRCRISV